MTQSLFDFKYLAKLYVLSCINKSFRRGETGRGGSPGGGAIVENEDSENLPSWKRLY